MTETVRLKEDYIRLGQALKAAGATDSGAFAKHEILDGFVKVNGETETRRGRKLVAGDLVEYNGIFIKIEAQTVKE